MRGQILHNTMAKDAETTLENYFTQVHPEYKCCKNGIITFFDLFARQQLFVLALQIETTARHGVDNAIKAQAVGIPLWIIVPATKIKIRLSHKLNLLQLNPGGEEIKILLLGQLRRELQTYLLGKSLSNRQTHVKAAIEMKGKL